jgi:hypothetical protein
MLNVLSVSIGVEFRYRLTSGEERKLVLPNPENIKLEVLEMAIRKRLQGNNQFFLKEWGLEEASASEPFATATFLGLHPSDETVYGFKSLLMILGETIANNSQHN